MTNEITQMLSDCLKDAVTGSVELDSVTRSLLDRIVSSSETTKGVLAVLTTLFVYKIIHPEQDIRFHQDNMPGGFSGRGIDMRCVTPFMKKHRFPAMAESGWLTRSLEQPYPYDLNYAGKITAVKREFLTLVDLVQTKGVAPRACLVYLFAGLVRQRDSSKIALACPHDIGVSQIISYLERHFSLHCKGTSRLPVLAIYALYECFMTENERYRALRLLPLESHTSADAQSGRCGDIDVVDADNHVFESVEVKHSIPISVGTIQTAYEKFKAQPVREYYLLTTANMDGADTGAMKAEVGHIKRQHGCEVTVNGVLSTIRYGLRYCKDRDRFIKNYIAHLAQDPVVKYDHKVAWNKIVAGEW